MSKDEILSAGVGTVTVAVAKFFDIIHWDSVLQAVLCGFAGALGGWIFHALIKGIKNKYNNQSIKKNNEN